MKKEYIAKSDKETKKIAKDLAKKILSGGERVSASLAETRSPLVGDVVRRKTGLRPEGAAVVGLIGELGGGKTTFAQGFAEGLGIKEKILSPTFVIMKSFDIIGKSFSKFYHFDCYRIKESKEMLELGWEEIIKNKGNIVLVEWADRIKYVLPKNIIEINFVFINETERKVIVDK